MRRFAMALGIIVSCLVSDDRDERQTMQVAGPVVYNMGRLAFVDDKGGEFVATGTMCTIKEGTLKPAGSDMRDGDALEGKAHEPAAE